MKSLYIFRHVANEGPGYLAEVLHRQKIPYRIISIDQGDPVPEDLDDASGLVFMGGSMSVNDDLPWIKQELALIRRVRASRLPVLGHCLGGQLISKALGGSVTAMPFKEIGWHPVRATENRSARDWLSALPHEFEVFHWHGESFTLPEGATPILQGQYCPHQAFAVDRMLALQCHIEMTADMVTQWAEQGEDELTFVSKTVQSVEAMTQNLPKKISELHKVAETIYQHWLQAVIDVQRL